MQVRSIQCVETYEFVYSSNTNFDNRESESLTEKIYFRSVEFLKNTHDSLSNSITSLSNGLKKFGLKKIESYKATKEQVLYLIYNIFKAISFTKTKENESILTGAINFFNKYLICQHYKECTDNSLLSIKELAGEILLDNLPIISTLNKLQRTYHISKNSLSSLKECWKIAYNRPIQAMANSFVHVSTVAFSVLSLYESALYDYNSFKDFSSLSGWQLEGEGTGIQKLTAFNVENIEDSSSIDSKTWGAYYKRVYKTLSLEWVSFLNARQDDIINFHTTHQPRLIEILDAAKETATEQWSSLVNFFSRNFTTLTEDETLIQPNVQRPPSRPTVPVDIPLKIPNTNVSA